MVSKVSKRNRSIQYVLLCVLDVCVKNIHSPVCFVPLDVYKAFFECVYTQSLYYCMRKEIPHPRGFDRNEPFPHLPPNSDLFKPQGVITSVMTLAFLDGVLLIATNGCHLLVCF